MYLGRYQTGQIVPLAAWCHDDSGTPTLPVASPVATVFSSSALVLSQLIPIQNKFDITARFAFRLQLDNRFSVGDYSVLYNWTVGSTAKGALDNFEVVAGGHGDGAGISMYYFRHPAADYVLQQMDTGKLRRQLNPRLT